MAYISSSANRWYCARESAYGQIPSITPANRIPAVKMTARQQREKSDRKDKTGSRTWAGVPAGVRRQTTFDLTTYMMDWADTSQLPSQGPLFEAAMGGSGLLFGGGSAAQGGSATNIRFAGQHGLRPGQAITSGGEMRFVAAIADANTVVLNAPFSSAPQAGSAMGMTATYELAVDLPSFSLFDYWSPSTATQRVFCGAAVDRMTLQVNGDFHQFQFRGVAQDVLDSSSFVGGGGGLTTFPVEPNFTRFDYSVVPGSLGQVWLGVTPNQFFTVAEATIEIRNGLDVRAREFGSNLPRAVSPGTREVLLNFELFSQDDDATHALYQAARQHVPVSVMFQLGQSDGSLMGIYLKSMIPDVPEFDDSDHRLRWKFQDTRAQGTAEDEMVVAFG